MHPPGYAGGERPPRSSFAVTFRDRRASFSLARIAVPLRSEGCASPAKSYLAGREEMAAGRPIPGPHRNAISMGMSCPPQPPCPAPIAPCRW